ncbi:MAG: ATPase [Clostridiales bacterium]|jgi:tRNA A37 threonylcarbamoyladenosine synthetase subunit TsaC/SUA5/YrdC|nr:ATPase [Clostridiales bacterium]
MDIYQLIDALEDLLESSAPVPLSGKRLVSVSDAAEIIRQLRLYIPEEMKEAARIKSERETILKKAEYEAQRLMKDAERQFAERVDDHEIISAAYKQANEIVAAAQANARELKKSSYEYTARLLEKVEEGIYGTVETLHENRREIETFKEQV